MRAVFLLLALLFSATAVADDYRFSTTYNSNTYPSAGEACTAAGQGVIGSYGGASSTLKLTGTKVSPTSSPSTFTCTVSLTQYNQWSGTWNDSQQDSPISRNGTSCPAGATYDPSTGSCKVDSKCTPLKDQSFAWGFKTAVGYVTNGGKHGVGEHVTKDGCEATTGSFQCDAASDGSDYGYCKGVATYTGLNATATDVNVGATTLGTDPNKDSNTNCGTGYTWSGSTCVKNPETTPDPGTGGGEGGGEGTGDGTGTGGGSTGGGSTGGGSTGGGTGGDGSGGTGTGDGTGTGTTPGGDDDKDDDAPDKSTVAGEACTASLSCSGDAIQCAILRQAREQKCQTAEWNDYSKAKDTINSAVAGKEYQLGESKTDISTGFDTGTRFLSAGCPAPKSYHSESFGRTFQISYQPACDYASAISALALAMASLFFIVYVGRGFGGD